MTRTNGNPPDPVTGGSAPAPASPLQWLGALRRARAYPLETLGLAAILATYADRDGRSIYPGQSRVADDGSIRERQTRTHIARLICDGWLTVAPGRGLGRGRGRAPDTYALAIPASVTSGSALPAVVTGGSQDAVTGGSLLPARSISTYAVPPVAIPAEQIRASAANGSGGVKPLAHCDRCGRTVPVTDDGHLYPHAGAAGACPAAEVMRQRVAAWLARDPTIRRPLAVLDAVAAGRVAGRSVADLVTEYEQAQRAAERAEAFRGHEYMLR